VQALDNVSLEIKAGRGFRFPGRQRCGQDDGDAGRPRHPPTGFGTITWNGRLNTEVSRATWGYLPEERGLYAKMKVLDQLVFFAKLHGVKPRDAVRETREWLERFRIPEYADRRAEQLSKGNQQKIQFIAAISTTRR